MSDLTKFFEGSQASDIHSPHRRIRSLIIAEDWSNYKETPFPERIERRNVKHTAASAPGIIEKRKQGKKENETLSKHTIMASCTEERVW